MTGPAPTARRLARFAAAAAGGLLTGACALQAPPVGEELAREALGQAVPPAAWTADAGAAGPVEAGWLGDFADPALQALVREALVRNADLRVAAARVEQAASFVRIAGGDIFPAVNALGRVSANDGASSAPLNIGALNVSWELDVWGRVRYGRRAAEDQYASAAADLEYARQSLAAAVVRSWLVATEAGLQRSLAQESLAAAEKLLALAEDRRRVGVGSELEVTLAMSARDGYRDTVRQLDLGVENARRALELLLGRYPAAALEQATTLPGVHTPVPAGVPADLLERRPDVIAAGHRVAAAFSRTGEAQAARLPRLSLNAGGSYIDSDTFVLQDRDNPVWSIGVGLLMPIYAGGALDAQVELRTLEQREAVADYARVGLKAFGEVENSLAGERAARERIGILSAQLASSERALELENVRYRVGSTDLRSVNQQQLAVYGARMSLLRVRTEQLVQRIALHLALGGDFDSEPG